MAKRGERPCEFVVIIDFLEGPDSRRAFVISSTNNGTPSVCSTICASTSGGNVFPSVIPVTICSTWAWDKRPTVISLTYGSVIQDG